jgi:undecaprenyl diphosphate synthase
MAKKIDITGMNIPQHVALILDGNGRWAKKRFLPRKAGHSAGAKTVEKIIEDAHDIGIKYLTAYVFSTENWNRPDDEVKALMKLLRNYLKDCIERADKNNMRCLVIGDKTGLDQDLVDI